MVGRPGNRFQLDSLPHDSDTAKMQATALPAQMIWVIIVLRVLTVLLKTRKYAKYSLPQAAIFNNNEYNNNNNDKLRVQKCGGAVFTETMETGERASPWECK